MKLNTEISKELIQEAIDWRRQLHSHPELGFEENQTAAMVAKILTSLGLQVHENIAKTGVVGVLKRGNSPKSLGIRADMDALPMQELGNLEHKSSQTGKMHACGHDGHTAILLGAAKYLALHGDFDGTVYFIFQPAEENKGGGLAMIKDGLFERFDIDEIYGLHNWPGKPLGDICVNDGAMMASFDIFDITLSGKGCHAAMPNLGADPIVAGSALVSHLQSIISRQVAPLDSAVLSITQFHAGDTYNIIPETAHLSGTVRAFSEEVRQIVKQKLQLAVQTIPQMYGVQAKLNYQDCYPATINDPKSAQKVRAAATAIFGQDKVAQDFLPTMASEDFSFMLNQKPGAYVWLGVDEANKPSHSLHNPYYDFNDRALPIGIKLWVGLVEQNLAKQTD